MPPVVKLSGLLNQIQWTMKFFTVNSDMDSRVESLLRKIALHKNGETSDSMKSAGAVYKLNYGVSLVHLRQMASGITPDQNLASRLWHRQIRETMILATFFAQPEKMDEAEINEWGQMIGTIELAEQVGQNFLTRASISETIVENWLKTDFFYMQYAALMAIGWRFRFSGEPEHILFSTILSHLEKLVNDSGMVRPVGFVLKSAGRFIRNYRSDVGDLAERWTQSDNPLKREVGEDVKSELEYL